MSGRGHASPWLVSELYENDERYLGGTDSRHCCQYWILRLGLGRTAISMVTHENLSSWVQGRLTIRIQGAVMHNKGR